MPNQSAQASNIALEGQFERHLSYPAMVGGAQRKPPIVIGAPAITQHTAFWIPDEIVREVWVHNIEEFILRLYFRLPISGPSDNVSALMTPNLHAKDGHLYLLENKYPVEPIISKTPVHAVASGYSKAMIAFRYALQHRKSIGEYPNRYQTVRFRFFWESMPVEASIERHNEYFTLFAAIDLSKWKCGRNSGPNAKNLTQALTAFNEIATARYNKICGGNWPSQKSEEHEALKTHHATIYYRIWDQLNKEVLKPPFDAVGAERLGKVVGDFRGLVVSRGGKNFIMPPGANPKGVVQRPPFAKNKDICCVDTLLPFVKAGAGDPPATVDYTFSQLLNGRCLHASALGAQPRTMEAQNQPVTDLLLATHADPWQLGRLVDRGNTLGTLRLAALYELQQLNEANLKLLGPEQELEKIAQALPGTTADDDRRGEVKTSVIITDLTKRLTNASINIAKAGQGIHGGLANRTERSGYYVKQFRDQVLALRIKRIEGFQRYDHFVNRRLGANFEFIETVGKRYERLQRMESVLTQQLRTAELAYQTGVIERLQEAAAIGFFVVLFPYYVSHVLIDLADRFRLASEFPSIEHLLGLDKSILLVSIAAGITLALSGWLKKRVKKSIFTIVKLFFLISLLIAVPLLLYAVHTWYQAVDFSPVSPY
jgi:hypothetical protein